MRRFLTTLIGMLLLTTGVSAGDGIPLSTKPYARLWDGAVAAALQEWDRVNGSMQTRGNTSTPLVIIDQVGSGKILSLRANGTEVTSITSSGAILIPAGSASAPALASAATPTSGLYWNGANELNLTLSGTRTHVWNNDTYFNLTSTAALLLGAASDVRIRRSAATTVTLDDGAGGALAVINTGSFASSVNVAAGNAFVGGGAAYTGNALNLNVNGTAVVQNNAGTELLTLQTADTPTCTSNCGTSPTSSGVGSSFTITMGATGTPASGFVITFATAWAVAPQCVGAMAKAGMVVGKLPLTLVTTTTTLTVVTNGTAPSTTDIYNFHCLLGQ